jgi:MATE family multidrug resistance protein
MTDITMTTSARAPKGTWQEVVTVAWPMVVSMVSYTLMGIVDTLLVARLGTAEVAAVGLATTLTFAVICFGLGFLKAVQVVASQATGAGHPDRARDAVHQGLVLALGIGVVSTCLVPLSDALIVLMGGSGDVAVFGGQYLEIRLLSAIPLFLGTASFGYFEGLGDTKTPMRVMIVANVVNVVLDLVLIFGFGPIPALGVAGAAWATVASQCFQGGLGLWLMWRATRGVRARFQLKGLRKLVRLGWPMAVQWSLDVFAWAVFVGFVARVSDTDLAAHTIVVALLRLSFLPGHAIGEATSILVGQSVGGRDSEAAKRVVNAATWVCLFTMCSLGIVFMTLGGPLVSLFRAEPHVVELGASLLVIAGLFQPVDAIAMVRSGALNGTGDTRYVMSVTVLLAWFVLLPVAWFLCNLLGWGAVGYWVQPDATGGVDSVSMARAGKGRPAHSVGCGITCVESLRGRRCGPAMIHSLRPSTSCIFAWTSCLTRSPSNSERIRSAFHNNSGTFSRLSHPNCPCRRLWQWPALSHSHFYIRRSGSVHQLQIQQ